MRKLFICALIALALAMIIAHALGGVAAMDPAKLGTRCATGLSARLAAYDTRLSMDRWAIDVFSWFFRPGAYAVSRVGIDPAGTAGLVIAGLLSWWAWPALPRFLWTAIGRWCGLTNAASQRRWILAGPPWRPCWKVVIWVVRWFRQFSFGSRATAYWTGILAAMTLTYRRGDCVYLGRLWFFGIGLLQSLGIRGPRHVLVVAAAGAGKTRWLMGWLGMLHPKASSFTTDCDGQIVNGLGQSLERKGHPVFNLDPYRLSRFPGACWNALDEITHAAKRYGRVAAVRFAQTLAEALIQEDNDRQPIFANGARAFIWGLSLYVWLMEPPERRNLVRVRELLTRGMPERVIDPKQDAFDVLLSVMEQTAAFDDKCNGAIVAVIARSAGIMRSGKGRDGNPFRSTAIIQTSWLDIPEIAAISLRSDFVGEDLRIGNPCVFICAPVADIQTKLSGWVRALTVMTMYAFQNMPGNRSIPCAFCIDEMPSLGRLQILEVAAPVFRKYGIRLVVITQDLEKLRQVYPDTWGGFIGNAQCTLWLSTDHQETLEYLSKILGTTTYIEEIKSGWFSNVPARLERRERPLMMPDQIREFCDPERGQFIVTRTGKPPLRVAYEGYDKALAVWDYEPDPNFREPILRALTRRVYSGLVAHDPPKGGSADTPASTSRKTNAAVGPGSGSATA